MFRLDQRQTENLLSTAIHLPGLALAVPGHMALCRRAKALNLPWPRPRQGGESLHLLVEGT